MLHQPAARGLPLVVFLAAIGYAPGLVDASETGRWALLSVGLPALLLMTNRLTITAAHRWGGALILWAFLSLLWTPLWPEGVDALWKLSLFGIAFCLGAACEDLRPAYTALAIGIGLSGLLAIAQLAGFDAIPQVSVPAGLFGNKDQLAEAGALALIGALGARRWWLVPGCLLATALPLGRGALGGLSVAGALWLWRRSKVLSAGLLVAAIGIAGLTVASQPNSESVEQRLAIWQSALSDLTPLGHGIGSFRTLAPWAPDRSAFGNPVEHAHNDALELIFELGIPGAIMAASLLWLCLISGAETERAILVAFLVMGLVGFPLHAPLTGLVASLAAGRLAALGSALRFGKPSRLGELLDRLATGAAR